MPLKDYVAQSDAPDTLENIKQDLNERIKFRDKLQKVQGEQVAYPKGSNEERLSNHITDLLAFVAVSDSALNMLLLRLASVVAYAEQVDTVVSRCPETVAMRNTLSNVLNMLNGTDPHAKSIDAAKVLYTAFDPITLVGTADYSMDRIYYSKKSEHKRITLIAPVKQGTKQNHIIMHNGNKELEVITDAKLEKDWICAIDPKDENKKG